MNNLSADFKELQDVLQKSKDHRNNFNSKYNDIICDLRDRYDKLTSGYTQRGKSNILAITDTTFKVMHYGYEADWTEEYPLELLTNPNFILDMEAVKQAKDDEAKQKRLAEKEAKDLIILAELKAKYE